MIKFNIVFSDNEYVYVTCPKCNTPFSCDATTEENLVFVKEKKQLLPQCPKCKRIGVLKCDENMSKM